MWNISYYTSPLIVTFLYRRGYFVAESIASMAKISTGIGLLVVISLCMRGIGRSQSKVYTKFAKALEMAKANSKNPEAKNQLRLFDFDFKDWPVDFIVGGGADHARPNIKSNRTNPLWISSLPCEIAAYIAIHTFGIRMIYPGTLKIVQSYLRKYKFSSLIFVNLKQMCAFVFADPVLVEGRANLIEGHRGKRYKLQALDGNDIDTLYVDNRNNGPNGKTLVICSEGSINSFSIVFGIAFCL